MSITENIDRIEQGKTSIISTIKSKGVDVPSGVLINEIAPYINEIQGGGDTPEYEGDYLIFKPITSDVNIHIYGDLSKLEYSLDNENFNKVESTEITVPKDKELTVRGNELCNVSFYGDNIYTISGELKKGNISNAYRNMFYNNSNLIDASKLKLTATELASNCYVEMFQNCTSLTTAPVELPATELKSNCYSYMFSGCTNLTQAPSLPATELASSCYSSMFRGCTNLTQAPSLPATQLKPYCYSGMFYNCTSLTTAPSLPSTTLETNSYYYMFYNCTSLNYIKHHIVFWNANYTQNWLNNVSATGTVECPADSTIPSNDVSGIPSGWTRVDFEFTFNIEDRLNNNEDILIIHNETDSDNTITIGTYNSSYFYKLSTDNEWNVQPENVSNTITVSGNENLYIIDLYNTNSRRSNALISSSGNISVSGNLTKGYKSYAYYYMFRNESNLIDASELKLTATELASYSYYYMFYNCTSLTTAPVELPATELQTSCYNSMFEGCTSLTTAPVELPATQLKTYCYSSMFYGCTNLTQAPSLPATTLKSYCYQYMFSGCTNLTQAPSLPATELASSCYSSMFRGCTNLTQAPSLPATELASSCYSSMFQNCTSLTTAPVELPATELEDYCYSSMFRGCTNLTQAPSLPATELVTQCYQHLFNGCTALNYIKHYIINWNTNNTQNWLNGVASSGVVECPLSSTIPSNDADGVPTGWTRVDF